jgi:hypothetical protein
MKSFKTHLHEEHILQFINRNDIADEVKDRQWANHWGYTQLSDGKYQHFTRTGAIFDSDYVRKWRKNGAHVDTELKESAIEPKVEPPYRPPSLPDLRSPWDPIERPEPPHNDHYVDPYNDSYDQTPPSVPPSIVDIWYAIPEWMREMIPPNHIPWITKELWKILEFYYGPPQNWDPVGAPFFVPGRPYGTNPWHTPFWMTPAFRGAIKILWGRYQRWRQGPRPQPFSPLQYPENIDPEYQVTPGWWA